MKMIEPLVGKAERITGGRSRMPQGWRGNLAEFELFLFPLRRLDDSVMGLLSFEV